jgi:glycosyltransferase involved in cell wall biosynthesis
MENTPYTHTFTVFTPTYNRAGLLPRVYSSLSRQTFKDFEWLVVDDGSTDNTKEVIESLAKGADFAIRYIWKPNGGYHTAINEGVKHARGMFFAILDSDDWYVDDALEKMFAVWNSIEDAEQLTCSGVCGLCAYENGQIVGSKFPSDVWDSDDFEAKNVHRIEGDKKGFKRTDVMRQFPFPEDIGRFVSQSTVWNRIGNAYSTRFVNRVFAIKEYRTGGISDGKRVTLIRNPRVRVLLLSELLNCKRQLPLSVRLKSTINLIRFSLHARVPMRELYRNIPNRIAVLPCFPVAVVLVLRDWMFIRRYGKNH